MVLHSFNALEVLKGGRRGRGGGGVGGLRDEKKPRRNNDWNFSAKGNFRKR